MVRSFDELDPIELPKQNQEKLNAIVKALRDGKLTLVAQLDGIDVVVPAELLRGHWVQVRGEDYLCAVDGNRNEIPPRYYHAKFGPPLS